MTVIEGTGAEVHALEPNLTGTGHPLHAAWLERHDIGEPVPAPCALFVQLRHESAAVAFVAPTGAGPEACARIRQATPWDAGTVGDPLEHMPMYLPYVSGSRMLTLRWWLGSPITAAASTAWIGAVTPQIDALAAAWTRHCSGFARGGHPTLADITEEVAEALLAHSIMPGILASSTDAIDIGRFFRERLDHERGLGMESTCLVHWVEAEDAFDSVDAEEIREMMASASDAVNLDDIYEKLQGDGLRWDTPIITGLLPWIRQLAWERLGE